MTTHRLAKQPDVDELYHARLINFKPTIPTPSDAHIYDDLAANPADYCTAYDDDDDDTDIYSYGEPKLTSNERLLYKLIMSGDGQPPPPPPPPKPANNTPNQCFSSSSTSSGLSCSSSSVLSANNGPNPNLTPPAISSSQFSSSSGSASNLGNSASLSSLLSKTSPQSTARYALLSAQLSKKSDEYHLDLVKVVALKSLNI